MLRRWSSIFLSANHWRQHILYCEVIKKRFMHFYLIRIRFWRHLHDALFCMLNVQYLLNVISLFHLPLIDYHVQNHPDTLSLQACTALSLTNCESFKTWMYSIAWNGFDESKMNENARVQIIRRKVEIVFVRSFAVVKTPSGGQCASWVMIEGRAVKRGCVRVMVEGHAVKNGGRS